MVGFLLRMPAVCAAQLEASSHMQTMVKTTSPEQGTPGLTVAELQLDQHIKDCGQNMTAAHAAGDRMTADQWRERMYRAIKSRSPEHQAKMTARIDSAIWFQSAEAMELGRAP